MQEPPQDRMVVSLEKEKPGHEFLNERSASSMSYFVARWGVSDGGV